MAVIRVLLIDDEEELVSTLVERLAIRGIESESVGNGREALKRLTEKPFDAVVLDVRLPGMSGLEVMKRIKSDYPAIRILLITGQGSLGEDVEKIPEEAYDVLLKPVNIDLLVKKLKAALEG